MGRTFLKAHWETLATTDFFTVEVARPYGKKNSSSFPVVVLEEPAKPLSAQDGSFTSTVSVLGKQDHITLSLVGAFVVKMISVLSQGST